MTMTSTNTAAPTPRWTARGLLLGDPSEGDDQSAALAASFGKHGVVQSGIKGLRRLSGPASRAVGNQLVEILLKSLDLLELKDLLGKGWRTCQDLIDAARRTRVLPSSEELVALAPHSIVSSHQPSIDLLVKETTVHTFVFDLDLEFELNGVLAVVRRARMVALRGGNCAATATLTLGGVPLLPPQQRQLDLTKAISMKPPVRLLKETTDELGDSSGPGTTELHAH